MIKKEHTCNVTCNEVQPIVSTSPTAAEEQFLFVMSERLGFLVVTCI